MNRELLRKYLIMGSQNCHRDPREILLEAIEAGITMFQYREKGEGSLSGRDKNKLGQDLRRICRSYSIPFIVNDDVELVDLLDADGIHVGQDDETVIKVRKKFPYKIIGLSVSNVDELKKSPIHLIDYVGAGPIFGTATKKDAKKPVSVKWIQYLRDQYPNLPIVGIGGINESNSIEVMNAGADGVSVISAITKSDHIFETVQKL